MTFEKYKQIVKGRRLVEWAVLVDVRKHGELHDYGEGWKSAFERLEKAGMISRKSSGKYKVRLFARPVTKIPR